MELLLNDLSLNGQFPDIATFRTAINRVMRMREMARQFGCHLFCHRNVLNARVTYDLKMQQAIQAFGREERLALMGWITRFGPFWEEERVHTPDDYLECNGEVVTETAVGEAAFRCFNGVGSRLVSLTSSSWEFSPVSVSWKRTDIDDRNIDVTNHWTTVELEAALRVTSAPVMSWEQLAEVSFTRFPDLTFSANSFDKLRGVPFVDGATHRILVLLDTLSRFKLCFDNNGQRTPEGQRLYQDHFTGDKAWFSDSSDIEKRKFKTELTFKHPESDGKYLFCPWKGKVKSPQIRIHFSWPVRANEPLYVVYVGPKITKR